MTDAQAITALNTQISKMNTRKTAISDASTSRSTKREELSNLMGKSTSTLSTMQSRIYYVLDTLES